MESFTQTRAACFGQEEGCLRCQTTGRTAAAGSETYLLLGPRNKNVQTTLVKAMQAADISFQVQSTVLALPLPQGRAAFLMKALGDHLSEATMQDVRGVVYTGDLTNPDSALAAFVQAETLGTLIAQAQYEWVRDALEDGWLFSVFHPILRAETQEVFAYEALLRARRPENGEVIGAFPLIDAAARLKLEHVLDQRARQAAIRNSAALGLPEMRVFINFMPNTIYDPEVCLRTTMQTAQECGIGLSQLVFEVVETESIPDMKRLGKILDYYRSQGAGTAVDDMGAGFSSLQYLTALRPDYVKLDRDLVVRAEGEKTARQALDVIIAQAKHLGIAVIAEGIETESQMRMCRDAGADFLQGFLFGRPANPPVVSLPQTLLKAA